MNQEKGRKKRLGALDICILTAILLCVIGVAARMAFRGESALAQDTPLESYTVYFSIENIRESSIVCFEEGMPFYIQDSEEFFGTLQAIPTTTPAKNIYTDENGNMIVTYNDTDDDRVSRIDAEGAFTISAKKDAQGRIWLGGNTYIAPYKELYLHSRLLSIKIRIISIVPGV